MSKRLTDTTKWENPWYRQMPWEYRTFWDYILDKCDHAGIWRVDLNLASYVIGKKILMKEALNHLGNRVIIIKDDKWFIPSYVTFQYGILRDESKVHKSAIKILLLHDIDPYTLTLNIPLAKGYLTTKDKDKDKDKDNTGEYEGGKSIRIVHDLEALYSKYPRKQGKTEGIARLKSMIKSDEDYKLLSQAIDNYITHIRRSGTEPQFIKQFSSFVGTLQKQSWRDWLDHDAGKTKVKKVSSEVNESMLAIALGVQAND